MYARWHADDGRCQPLGFRQTTTCFELDAISLYRGHTAATMRYARRHAIDDDDESSTSYYAHIFTVRRCWPVASHTRIAKAMYGRTSHAALADLRW